jgi:hypothetical protein
MPTTTVNLTASAPILSVDQNYINQSVWPVIVNVSQDIPTDIEYGI